HAALGGEGRPRPHLGRAAAAPVVLPGRLGGRADRRQRGPGGGGAPAADRFADAGPSRGNAAGRRPRPLAAGPGAAGPGPGRRPGGGADAAGRRTPLAAGRAVSRVGVALMSYWQATRHPAPSLLFLAPLLTAYELGVVWLGG